MTPSDRSRITATHQFLANPCGTRLRADCHFQFTHSPLHQFTDCFSGGAMNKQELIAKIAQDTGLTKTNAAAAVDSFFEGITKSLKKGQPITFVGFGTFKTSQRKARTARNPQTGAAIKIPKRRVVRFSAGKALKSAVN
ncbi:MAG TPA: HU family DNA-binding protein [Vicinamibacterales bacterium]|nr:HU family DNA-binding protein [Vicinamibacterales bacterium]